MGTRYGRMISGAALAGTAVWGQADWRQELAPGPWIGLADDQLAAVRSFRRGDPVVGTYLFYWYDVHSGAHVRYGDGGDPCTTHPPTWDGYSYTSPAWWRDQFRDITAAGIDFAAPVYWGHPGGHAGWSFQGLPPMVEALDALAANGETAPKAALFYDTSTLQHNGSILHADLTTADGKAWFYQSIRDFWSCIPPRHWAAVDGRPIILLYSPAFARQQDPALFPMVRARFRADFGVDPYLIKQSAWVGEADNTCEWGGALGLKMAGCAALGPGYDHTAVRGRQPLIREREGGAFYTASWETLLRFHPARRPWLAMVETWNEFHEGTDVAHSLEYGRQYIDLTRRFADLFRRRVRLPAAPGPFTQARSVATALGAGSQAAAGIVVPSRGDGIAEMLEVAGRLAVRTAPSPHGGRFLYAEVDDSFAFDLDPRDVAVQVEYWDAGCRAFALHYDSLDPAGSVRDGAFKAAGEVAVTGSGQWRTADFALPDARFSNRANGADFRLAVLGPGDLTVCRITVSKPAGPVE